MVESKGFERNMESQGFSVYSGMMGFPPLLGDSENKPSKKYVIFDQSENSRRIWMPPHLLETISLQETIALGFATYENAKAARAKSVFLSPADPARRENGSRNIDSVSDNANSYQTEASEELDALLSSEDDEEGEDEVTSSITFADSEEFWGCSGASDEMDQSKKWRQAGIAGAKQNDADIGEFNLEKRRHGDADGDVHLPSPKCRNLQ
ncbi:uncharacterized protein LOC131071467 [Cryptomeria japonica]|uniref:uncharacterized protein LOC131071467 n=1 Tax=Cryptomeria japonica TaxID=3369 RepID=UPI0025ACDFB1|nr:uncharacterized protein LOC131071467 [Cryptomeria japonica]XP_057863301.1 uncharacterized protein LOC131071467 [Cryptomeria japonica]XP_057863302.1 uncharacterized protein LOC131071467 [Cryptomeria japonica]XP_057863303.1 uncharacterized protein LOC131071467 [Cryptomeria japonica]XP_057863304.2 uncharacterized protein LOC131071467 [Cryptomeria japonica]XP_059063309.1 uncharacterized protein LOC131071467 [Cryptomeria japonica]XP_059063310.1 uncharacterized protein LOC131071467 [Cryptomeria 